MSLSLPSHQRKHTFTTLAYGALLLAWLTPEDNTLIIVSILGWGLSALLVGLAALRWFGGRAWPPRQWIPALILAGALIGLGAVLCTFGLMIFKNAWHSHAYPDFPALVVIGILRRVVVWTAVGGLMGGASVLILLGRGTT